MFIKILISILYSFTVYSISFALITLLKGEEAIGPRFYSLWRKYYAKPSSQLSIPLKNYLYRIKYTTGSAARVSASITLLFSAFIGYLLYIKYWSQVGSYLNHQLYISLGIIGILIAIFDHSYLISNYKDKAVPNLTTIYK